MTERQDAEAARRRAIEHGYTAFFARIAIQAGWLTGPLDRGARSEPGSRS